MKNKLYSIFTASLVMIVMLLGCGTVKHQPTTTTQTTTIIKDSIRWKDSTVLVPIPVERYVDVVRQYDTLRLETSMAKSEAFVDTLTHTLKGNLEHKPEALKTVIKYKDRIVVEYRDSIVTKEVPVEVEVIKPKTPRWAWRLLVFDVLVALVFGAYLYLKFKGIIKL